MKSPPGAPPPNSLAKAKDDDWDDALGDDKVQTVSPDIVRKLLEMNPALRQNGMTTNVAVAQVQKAHLQASDGKKAVTAPAKASAGEDIFAAFAGFKGELASKESRCDLELQRIELERQAARTSALDRVHRWLQTNDPDMRSPVTHEVLARDKAFFDGIGFSVKGYVDARMKKK